MGISCVLGFISRQTKAQSTAISEMRNIKVIMFINIAHYIFYITHFAYCSTLGLCLAANKAQNTTDAHIEGRSSPARSFRYFVYIKKYRSLIKYPAFSELSAMGKTSNKRAI